MGHLRFRPPSRGVVLLPDSPEGFLELELCELEAVEVLYNGIPTHLFVGELLHYCGDLLQSGFLARPSSALSRSDLELAVGGPRDNGLQDAILAYALGQVRDGRFLFRLGPWVELLPRVKGVRPQLCDGYHLKFHALHPTVARHRTRL